MYKKKLEKYDSKILDIVNQLGGITLKGSILDKSTYYFCNNKAAKLICKLHEDVNIGTTKTTSKNYKALSQNEINGVLGMVRVLTKDNAVAVAATVVGAVVIANDILNGPSRSTSSRMFQRNNNSFNAMNPSSTNIIDPYNKNYVGYKVEEGNETIEYVGTYSKTLKKVLDDKKTYMAINAKNLVDIDKRVYLIDAKGSVNWEKAKKIVDRFYEITKNEHSDENIIDTVIELKINTASANKWIQIYRSNV